MATMFFAHELLPKTAAYRRRQVRRRLAVCLCSVECINVGFIIAGPARNYVSLTVLSKDLVVAGLTVYNILLTGYTVVSKDLVVAGLTVYTIVASVAIEPVIPLAAADVIRAISTSYPITTSVAVQLVDVAKAIHSVLNSRVSRAVKLVLAGGTFDRIHAPIFLFVCTRGWTPSWLGSLGKAAVQ